VSGAARCIAALAGRRIDADGADPARFPLSAAPLVRQRVTEVLRRERPVALVCSGACGADLIALEAAGKLGIRRRVVLPFPPARFREESVMDRPGNWGGLFDAVIAETEAAGDLVVLHANGGDQAFAAANAAIVEEARSLAAQSALARLLAIIVWDGAPRGKGDATLGFRELATAADFEVREILTG